MVLSKVAPDGLIKNLNNWWSEQNHNKCIIRSASVTMLLAEEAPVWFRSDPFAAFTFQWLKSILEGKDPFILLFQNHECWWPSDTRRQAISSHAFDLLVVHLGFSRLECSGLEYLSLEYSSSECLSSPGLFLPRHHKGYIMSPSDGRCWNRNIPGDIGQYYSCRCPGCLYCQVFSNMVLTVG